MVNADGLCWGRTWLIQGAEDGSVGSRGENEKAIEA